MSSHKWCSNIGVLGGCVKKMISTKYLRFKNQGQKPNPILDSKDRSMFIKSQKKSKKNDIIEKLNEVIQMLKYEGMDFRTLEESSFSSSK